MPEKRSAQRRAAGEGTGTAVSAGEYAITAGESFVWKSDRAEVRLSIVSDGWIVEYSALGRLLGPPQMLHQERHQDPKHAAWDVMARVQKASNNENEMMRAGQYVVRWLNSKPRRPEPDNGPSGRNGSRF
jgi:hypothetical protein